jgi:dolichyl-phosphate-mannose--protein O-mannosyl transferase
MGKSKSNKNSKANIAKKNDNEIEIDLSTVFNNVNKGAIFLVFLAIILVLGYNLRAFNLDYPVIGYHNWKSVHHFSEARNYAREGFFKHGFFIPMRDTLESIKEPMDGQHFDTFPTTAIIVGFFFKIFGESIVLARIINILFSLATVVVMYLLIKKLFEREDLALLTAFFMSINPLLVFFSHNMMMEASSLFLLILGMYFFVLWYKNQLEKNKFTYLYAASFCVMLGVVTKFNFAFLALPIMFTFPYLKILKNWKKALVPIAICLFISSGFFGWYFYGQYYNSKVLDITAASATGSNSVIDLIDLSIINKVDFWQKMRPYFADNFTLTGILIMFFS